MEPLCWASAGHRATSFSFVWGCQERQAEIKMEPPDPTVASMSSGTEPVTNWEQEGAHSSCLFPSALHPGCCHILVWQWASGNPEPQHCSGIAWLSQPRALQPHPCVLPCSGQAWDKLSQGWAGGTESVTLQFLCESARPCKHSLCFQELRSFFISAWRYPRNFRKYLGSSASTDLILICGLGLFFLVKTLPGVAMPKLGWEGKRDSVFQCTYFFLFSGY